MRNNAVDDPLLEHVAQHGFCASGQKFTEPVAFSSTIPANFRLAPSAPRNSFGLLTLRARCTTQPNDDPTPVKAKRRRPHRSLRRLPAAGPPPAESFEAKHVMKP